MNAGLWIRVSTDEQAKGESPEHHRKRAISYIENVMEWKKLEEYDLSGVSGKSVINHPDAQRMLNDMATGRIQALVFSKLARLGRNLKELIEISEYAQKYNVRLVSLDESIDTGTPAGMLLFHLTGALAQWEREEISARVSASVPIRAKLKKPLGGQGPFGYMWKDREFVVNPDESPIVKEIYQTFLGTRKLLTTAKIINQKGYRTKKNKEFGKTTIKRILTDTTYKGRRRANYSKSKGNKKSWILKPKEEWVHYDVDAIITVEDWDLVNSIIRQIEGKYDTAPSFIGKYLFSGLITCSCGTKMYGYHYSINTGLIYRCGNCKAKVAESVLLDKLKEGLNTIIITPEQLNDINTDSDEIICEKMKRIKILSNALKKNERSIDNLFGLVEDGKIDSNILSERLEKLNLRKTQLLDESANLKADIDSIEIQRVGRQHVLKQAESLSSLWEGIDKETQGKLIKELVHTIRVWKNEISIEFYYIPEAMSSYKGVQTLRGSWQPPA